MTENQTYKEPQTINFIVQEDQKFYLKWFWQKFLGWFEWSKLQLLSSKLVQIFMYSKNLNYTILHYKEIDQEKYWVVKCY